MRTKKLIAQKLASTATFRVEASYYWSEKLENKDHDY